MKRKTLFWIILFGVLAAAGAGVYLLRGGGGTQAVIYVDGEVYDSVDLDAVAVPYEITVETEWGWNVVRVSQGSVQVVRADCDGQDCVRQGAIEDGAVPIVCLPHRVVIQIEEP